MDRPNGDIPAQVEDHATDTKVMRACAIAGLAPDDRFVSLMPPVLS
jgi:hypothetical protein